MALKKFCVIALMVTCAVSFAAAQGKRGAIWGWKEREGE